MKRIIVLLFFVMILFSSCSNSYHLEEESLMSEINKQSIPYIRMNALSVYVANKDDYLIVIDNNDSIQKSVMFSSERNSLQVEGLILIEDSDITRFVNMRFDKVKEIIGQPHCDIGSGFYIPAYITKGAYLICFGIANETVFEVIKRDLFTNEIVEHINA